MTTSASASPLEGLRLALLGAGHMGEALLHGLLLPNAYSTASQWVLSTPRAARRAALETRFHGVRTTADNGAAVAHADVVILAVKPPQVGRVLQNVQTLWPPSCLLISLAAGISLPALEGYLGSTARVVRAMPNTPVLVQAGATAVARGSQATTADMALAHSLFGQVGLVVEVEDTQLDAVTGLSGCGPAYVFMLVEALCEAAVRLGLPRPQALALATQTIRGSGVMLQQTQQHPAVLREQVTSPGGATSAGLQALEQGSWRSTIMHAVIRATYRARQLGAALKRQS